MSGSALMMAAILFPPSAEATDLSEFLARSLPTSGSVMVTYEVSGDAKQGKVVSALDVTSGAYFRIHHGRFFGRSADGQLFDGVEGESAVINPDRGLSAIATLASWTPLMIHRAIVRDPSLVVSSSEGSGGSRVIEVLFPAGIRGATRAEVQGRSTPDARASTRWTSDGRLEGLEQPWTNTEGAGVSTIQYELSPQSPPKFPVAAHLVGKPTWPLKELKFSPTGFGAAFFEPQAVAKLAQEVRTKPTVGGPITITRDTPIPDRIEPGMENVAKPGSDLARYRWPLVTGGTILIALGIFAWWRNRR
jgi:hypothetical protein